MWRQRRILNFHHIEGQLDAENIVVPHLEGVAQLESQTLLKDA